MQNSRGWVDFMKVSYTQQTSVVRKLLSARASTNFSNGKGRAALQLACCDHCLLHGRLCSSLRKPSPNIDVICELLSARADVNHEDSHGETALLWVAKENKWDGDYTHLWVDHTCLKINDTQQTVMRKLLCARASANLAHLDGIAALQLAVAMGDIDVIREVLSARGDPNSAVCLVPAS